MRNILLAGTVLSGACIFSTFAYSAACVVSSNGTIDARDLGPAANKSGCTVSSIATEIGNTSVWNIGFIVDQWHLPAGGNRTITVDADLTTVVKGSAGIAVGDGNAAAQSIFDARGKTIDLTIKNLDANASSSVGDNIPKSGAGVSDGGLLMVGTLNLTMENLPVIGNAISSAEHYGVVAGSSVNAAEDASFNGMKSAAVFDNLNIKMQSSAVGGLLGGGNPLLAGIRVIQGAGSGANSGQGSAGYVEVAENLILNIDATSNDAIGIYISGTEKNGVVPEVKLNNSNIVIKSTSNRANAIRLGKDTNTGTGGGKLTSTGHMEIDTTQAKNDAAIDVIWQGAVLNANADTASTTITAGREVIGISGNASQSSAQTITSFNNLVASTISTTANLVEVAANQKDYQLNVRGSNSLLTASAGGFLVNVAGTGSSASKTTFNFSEGVMKGLTNKTSAATLNLNIDHAAKWILQEKTGTNAKIATFSQLDLRNEAEVVAVGTGGTLADYTLAGNINSIGGILNMSDGIAGDLLTLKGNYVGSQNAVVQFDTFLGASGSLSDILVNDGGSITGQTLVRIKNTDATQQGGVTEPGHGIKLVNSINDGTTSADAFILDENADNAYEYNGRTVVGAGAYGYSLYKGANPNATTPDDDYGDSDIAEDWYLRSVKDKTGPNPNIDPDDPLYTQGVPVYEAYPQVLLALNSLPTLQQRVGNRYWSHAGNIMIEQGADVVGTPQVPAAQAGSFTERNGIWGRIEGQHLKAKPAVTTSDTNYDVDTYKMQAGLDGVLTETENGLLIGGITVHYGHASAKTYSSSGLGKISTDGYGFGGTLTWYGNEGFYVDTQAQFTWYDSDLSARGVNRQTFANGNNGFGYALSAETGKRFMLNDNWSLTPQAQLVYSHVDFDTFTDRYSGVVSLDKGASLQGRVGLTADYQQSWYNSKGTINRSYVYGIANLYYEFLDGTVVDVSSVRFTSRNDRVWGGIGLGGSYNWDNDKYSVYGEGSVNTSLNHFGDSYAYKGTIGLRVKW